MKQLCWDKIIQVLFPSQKGEITCPICMNDQSEIVAPQITPCGHIYCYHCYLRHDDISDTKNYCPLCGEYAPNCDLKSAKIIDYESCKDEITFQLLMRQENEQIIYRADTLTEDPRYSKIMIAKAQYIVDEILQKEKEELNKFMLECISTQETWNIPYIEQALEINDKKAEKFEKLILQEEQQHLLDLSKHKKKSSKLNGSPTLESQVPEEQPNFYFKSLTPLQFKKSQMQYFYQEKSGLLIFLNPINNKFLFEEMNKENKIAPSELKAKLISLQNACADQNLQKRYPYLKHIPPYSDILFAEVDMNGIINPENVKKNDAELAAIHKKHKEKEERELKKMQKNRKMSDNPYGQYYDREYYLMNGLIKFPPTNMPTEEKHYPTLQAQQSAPPLQQQEEEQKQQDNKKSKKIESDGEDDYVIVSKSGQFPSNYIDKQSRQKIKEMQNEVYFPTLGNLQGISGSSQQNKKKASTDINLENSQAQSDILITQQQQFQIQNEIKKQNEVIVDLENNVIIDGDQIYDEWNQQTVIQKAKSENFSKKSNNNSNNNNNKKKNKKVALDGNFFF